MGSKEFFRIWKIWECVELECLHCIRQKIRKEKKCWYILSEVWYKKKMILTVNSSWKEAYNIGEKLLIFKIGKLNKNDVISILYEFNATKKFMILWKIWRWSFSHKIWLSRVYLKERKTPWVIMKGKHHEL